MVAQAHTSLDRPAKTESMLSRLTEWPFTLRMVSPGDREIGECRPKMSIELDPSSLLVPNMRGCTIEYKQRGRVCT